VLFRRVEGLRKSALTLTGFILTYDIGVGPEGLLGVLLKNRVFVGLFAATWVVILIRFALTRTGIRPPAATEPKK